MMQIRIAGKQVDIGNALPSHVRAKLSAVVEKYFSGRGDAHVTFAHEGAGFRSDCTIHLNSGIILQASGVGVDAYVAFDAALARIEKRVRRYARRLKNHHDRTAVPVDAMIASERIIAAGSDVEEAEEPDSLTPVIIAETEAKLRSWNVGEAVMQLDLQENPVLVFRNSGSGSINVVYRRPDGNIGWIDPVESQA